MRTVPGTASSKGASAETQIQHESGSGSVGRMVVAKGGVTSCSGDFSEMDSEPRLQLIDCSYSKDCPGSAVRRIRNDSARSRVSGEKKTLGCELVS
jgi:hypothetical protein